MRILAETGRVDWNTGDKLGWTPLYCALRRGHSNIVDIAEEDDDGREELRGEETRENSFRTHLVLLIEIRERQFALQLIFIPHTS